VEEKHVPTGQPRPHPKGWGPTVPHFWDPLLGTPSYAQTVRLERRNLVWWLVTQVGWKRVSRGQPRPHPKGWDPPSSILHDDQITCDEIFLQGQKCGRL